MRILLNVTIGLVGAAVIAGCSSGTTEDLGITPSPRGTVITYGELLAEETIAANDADIPATPAGEIDDPGAPEIVQASVTPSNQQAEVKDADSATSVSVTISSTAILATSTPLAEQTTTANALAPSPTPVDPSFLNGFPVESIVVMPDEVRRHAREIYARGQSLGRNSHAFSKLGDSLIANPHFLSGFDTLPYDLGNYEHLRPAVDHFSGSFERYGVGIHAGLHSWGIFDPMWADKNWCQPNETIVACEFRLNNPGVLLILLGSNDAGAPDSFEFNLRKVVEFSIESGVIPVIATKADRFEGPENTNNIILKQIAADFNIPLWDFDLLADTLPGRGLKEDNVHLTPFDEFDYSLPEAFETGHGVHNLSALLVLDAIRTQVIRQ